MIIFISLLIIPILLLISLLLYYLNILSNKMESGIISDKEANDLIEKIKLDEKDGKSV